MSRRPTLLRAAVTALAAALALGGCTADEGTPAPEPSLTLAKSPTPTDVGPTADFLDVEEDRPLATTPARDDSSYSGATFAILEVRSTERSTLVVWSATHPRTLSAGSDFDVTAWRNFPVLSTKSRAYSVLTYEATTGQVECACVDMRAMRAEPNPQGALYPPLPADTASVTLTSPWFRDVTVPVTHG
ncbi:hypothetical protein LG324_08675 [Phycicoccus jejuensis]|uniref:hypothetical protein n=1 Tax=Phycicoccus TaxID=367298 RepID=UPI001A8EACDF|nr:hypothetical protein [Phycicoccus sp. DTK01]GIL35668.1 hypothetical protein PDTK01_17430 [Phycicoccus sp. DTK01]